MAGPAVTPTIAPPPTPAVAATPTVAPTTAPPLPPAIQPVDVTQVEYDPIYDSEIKEVFRLANANKWEAARAKSAGLVQFDPKNAMLQRLNTWVVQQGKQRREQALEDEIRNIDANHDSTYNPDALDVLKEKKDHGLPARKDVRDAVDLIESTPWIPKNFGKTIHEQGPLFDFEAAKGPMGKVLEKEVSIHLDNVPFETVILNLSQSSGVNIIADKTLPALTNRLTINLDKVKLGEFFKYVGRNYAVQFQVGQDLVWMIDAASTNRLMEEVRFYKLRKGFVLPALLGAEDITRSHKRHCVRVARAQRGDHIALRFGNDHRERPLLIGGQRVELVGRERGGVQQQPFGRKCATQFSQKVIGRHHREYMRDHCARINRRASAVWGQGPDAWFLTSVREVEPSEGCCGAPASPAQKLDT